jgi:hypothetical protein
VTRGKPWTADEETTLKALVEANTPIEVIAAKLEKKPLAVYAKILRLGLTLKPYSGSLKVPLPKELPSIEEALKKVSYAMEAISTPGLDKNEVRRLQVLASLSKTYQELLANYINYREIENKLKRQEAEDDALFKKMAEDDASERDSSQSRSIRNETPPD